MSQKPISNPDKQQEVEIGDPYQKWLVDLENNLNFIGQLLFTKQYADVLRQEYRVVLMLNAKSKNALAPLKAKVEHWMFKSNGAKIKDLHDVHDHSRHWSHSGRPGHRETDRRYDQRHDHIGRRQFVGGNSGHSPVGRNR